MSKITTTESDNNNPPPGHKNMLVALTLALATPKSEIDRREKEWKEQEHKRGRPKKAKKP